MAGGRGCCGEWPGLLALHARPPCGANRGRRAAWLLPAPQFFCVHSARDWVCTRSCEGGPQSTAASLQSLMLAFPGCPPRRVYLPRRWPRLSAPPVPRSVLFCILMAATASPLSPVLCPADFFHLVQYPSLLYRSAECSFHHRTKCPPSAELWLDAMLLCACCVRLSSVRTLCRGLVSICHAT